jgi:hypothetical protein
VSNTVLLAHNPVLVALEIQLFQLLDVDLFGVSVPMIVAVESALPA